MKNILIVDDEAQLRDVIVDELIFEGHKAVSAGSVNEALEILKNQSIDLIISDVRMPKKSGTDLLLQKKVPVILMSGFTELTKEKARELGAIELLAKPFDYKRLEEVIENLH